jgi:release factor glutamine methyltransferase
MNYEQITVNNEPKNKPNQSQFFARQAHPKPKQTQLVPAKPPCRDEVLYQAGMAKPDQTRHPSKLFFFFTSLRPGYNLPMQNWTIQKLLNWITQHFTEKGIDSPRLSAEMLLCHILGLKRIELYTQFDKQVDKEHLDRLRDLVKRAAENEPVAYLVGMTEFYSLQMKVTPDCMIPRPETELLVERAVEFLRTRTGPQFVCDLCTGCGCIAVAIANNFPDARIIATDICDAALSIAAENVEKHQLNDRITLLCGNLFDPIVPHLDISKFDLIVCNPPYVSAFATLPT